MATPVGPVEGEPDGVGESDAWDEDEELTSSPRAWWVRPVALAVVVAIALLLVLSR